MKKNYLIVLCCAIILFSCSKTKKKELIYLGKNAYEYPVWRDMLLLDKVKFSNVVDAFKAYKSNNKLDRETIEHFEKFEKRSKKKLDSDGFLLSDLELYRELLSYRRATPNGIEQGKNSDSLPHKFYTKGIPNKNGYGMWKNIGPFGNPEVHWSATGNGAVQYVEMHPTNPAIMYVCIRNGGLWKTVNYGKNWTPETDHFATNNTSCLSISKQNPQIFYLGTAQDQKILYSSDSGNSWVDRSNGIEGEIYDIHSDPNDASRVIAATTKGIFLSTDSGLNWERKIKGQYGDFTDIDVSDNWDFILITEDYQSNNMKPLIYFSKDKGDTFIEYNPFPNIKELGKIYFAFHEGKNGKKTVYLYVMSLSNKPTRFIGLYKSEFNPNPADGKSFFDFKQIKHPTYNYPNGDVPLIISTKDTLGFKEASDGYGGINPCLSASWVGEFYVSPNNSNRLVTMREKFWGSDDGGILWEMKPSYGGSNWADNRYITTNIAKDTVYWCNDGGIWAIKEDDLFPSKAVLKASGLGSYAYSVSKVVSKNGDICISEGTQMDMSLLNKGVFMTGGQDIGQIFTRNGRDSHVASADVYRGRIKPDDDKYFITGALKVILEDGKKYEVYDDIEPDHFNPNILYGFTKKYVKLVRSPKGKNGWLVKSFKGENRHNTLGHSWTPVDNKWREISIPGTQAKVIHSGTFEQSRANANIAFFGDESNNRFLITENLQDDNPTWVELKNAPKSAYYRIATHQYNEDVISLVTDKSVYISFDKGESWKIKEKSPSSTSIRKILMDRNTSEGVYAMTQTTIFYHDEILNKWVEFNKGLPLNSIKDMRIAYYPNDDNRLYVTKYGRGVWSSNLVSVARKNKNKPKASFTIHGNSFNIIEKDSTVQLKNQSSNATNYQWTLKNGTDVIVVNDIEDPIVKLTKKGFYSVKLKATNSNGDDVVFKDQFIRVFDQSNVSCKLVKTEEIHWYQRIDFIKFNKETYDVPSGDNYIKSNKVFKLTTGQNDTIYFEDNYKKSFEYYTKIWIDFNNDGVLDDKNETVGSSNGRKYSFTSTFTVPSNAVLGKSLLMRMTTLDDNNGPSPCQKKGTRQTIDFTVVIKPKINFTLSHKLLSANSVELTSSFNINNTLNILESGFVLSNLNADLNVYNSKKAVNTSSINNNTFNVKVNDLNYNSIYYYRPYIKTDIGYFYGDKKSFTLTPYKELILESIRALKITDNKWNLKSKVILGSSKIDKLELEYGTTSFDSSIIIDIIKYSTENISNLSNKISTKKNKTYKFRLKGISSGKTIYSNIATFNTFKSTICTPIVDTPQFFREITKVSFNGIVNDYNDDDGYQDFSSTKIFDVEAGKSYPLIVHHYIKRLGNHVVFIDYNDDGIFDVNYEKVSEGAEGQAVFKNDILIPTEGVVYNKPLRMRIINYLIFISPCKIEKGEIEDYSIRIKPKSKKDNDGDGILDNVDNCPSTSNPTQIDSDNNGIGDACQDTDGDGVLDSIDNCPNTSNPTQADSDNNGIGDVCQDTDGDGVLDNVDNCPSTSNPTQIDSDNNGIGDACQDTDGDGVLDSIDNCPNTSNPTQADSDNNGIGDVCQDTDGDGVLDNVDNCPSTSNSTQADSDNNGIGDVCQDTDGDGVLDNVDNCPSTSNPTQADLDNNGVGDVCQDTDGDGIIDKVDNCPSKSNPTQIDSDNNGVGDVCQDTDGDGIIDSIDNCPITSNLDQADSDNNGVGDACQDTDGDGVLDSIDNCPNTSNTIQFDLDNNGVGDVCQDTDGDGVLDNVDNCPSTSNPKQEDIDNNGVGDVCQDTDGDGIIDKVDNCPSTSNPTQEDSDNNGVGDVCQDTDGDGVLDNVDNCLSTSNPTQIDSDNNGIGDACQDTDGDGVLDSIDNCPITSNLDQADSDNNGVGDVCQDTDGDGIIDIIDNCPSTSNPDQADSNNNGVGDICQDTDGDGIIDIIDNCPNRPNSNQADSDNDGVGDVCQDTDGDGIMDSIDNCITVSNINQEDINNNGIGDVCDTSYEDINNFDIQVVPETCYNKNDAKIILNIVQTFVDYTVTIKGNKNITKRQFTRIKTFSNFPSGSYLVCIEVNGRGYKKCFDVEIKKSPLINLKMSNDYKLNEYNFNVISGTPPFKAYINGKEIGIFNNSNFKLKTNQIGLLTIKTSKSCEGEFKRRIEGVLLKQNPIKDFIEFSIPLGVKSEINVTVLDDIGRVIINKPFVKKGTVLSIPFREYSSGIYFIRLGIKDTKTFKIMKTK